MNRTEQIKLQFVFMLIACLTIIPAGMVTALVADSRADVVIDTESGKPIILVVNKLAKLKSSREIKRAHVVNPAIAELIYSDTQSPQWVFVSGKAVGTTQLTLWDKDNNIVGTFEIIVNPDTAGLKKSLYEIFPKENISVRSSGEHITLAGTVSSAEKLSKILVLAQAYAPDKVINLLQVGGIQQVMLEVRIAEMSKSAGNRLGVNFAWAGANAFGVNILNNLINPDGWPVDTATEIASSVTAALGFSYGDPVIIAIDALQEDGLLKILARPTLIAQSGQNASFLAGGEFPYPIAQDTGEFTIEWKPFGIGLNFTPTVLGDDTISLVVSPEVSDLDFTRTVSFAGYVVPAIDTRRMSTVVELKDNQSFAIAGLLKNYVRESVKKFPLLGDIPIIGAIFRSTRFQKDETELVVIVTPHLVKPVDGDTLPLPTDSFEEPTPFEMMMLGMFEKYHDPKLQAGSSSEQNGMQPIVEGDFGYIIPE